MVSLYSKLTKTQKVMLNHSALDKLLKITFFTFRPLMILQVDQNLKSQAIVIVPWTRMKIIFFVFISFLFLKTISVFKRKKYSPILLNQKYVYRRTSRFLMTARQGNFSPQERGFGIQIRTANTDHCGSVCHKVYFNGRP